MNKYIYSHKSMTPDELRQMQLIQVDLLSELDRICRKYSIKYILDAGTLLGAVRYGKFIPWDDDIDIRMLRSEYKKFCKVCADELDETMFFQNYNTDANYLWLYAKLRRNGTTAVRLGQEHLKMHCGVFIDIFPCDGVPTSKILRAFRSFVAMLSRKILYSRVTKKTAGTLLGRVLWSFVSIIPKGFAFALSKFLSRMFDEEKCELVGSLGWHAPKDIKGFKKEWFIELTEVAFEGKNFLAPLKIGEFLEYSFGEDYMTPPPIEKQKISAPLSSYELLE